MDKKMVLVSAVAMVVVAAFAFSHRVASLSSTIVSSGQAAVAPAASAAEPAAPSAASPSPISANATTAPTVAALPAAPAPAPMPALAIANEPANWPVRLQIPSIDLNDPIEPLGVNAKGEMAVPNGSTSKVGWYEYGTIPGNEGSAALDAHVFAAFAKLNQVKVGDEISVTANDGAVHRFRVYETDTYALADVPLQRFFNDASGRFLNLITCAGHLTPDHSTYDHRLVIYAELVN